MKLFLRLGVVILFIGLAMFYFNYSENAEACCGKCNGSSYCKVCSNCSRCQYCNSGGSCGACRSPEPAPVPISKPVNKKNKTEQNSGGNSDSGNEQYVVNTKTLNIRDKPSTQGKVLYTAKAGETVTVVGTYNAQWVKVKVSTVTGFAYKQFLVLK